MSRRMASGYGGKPFDGSIARMPLSSRARAIWRALPHAVQFRLVEAYRCCRPGLRSRSEAARLELLQVVELRRVHPSFGPDAHQFGRLEETTRRLQ